MFLLLRLILAHFVADFLFQPDEVFAARKKSFHGASIHYFLIFFTLILFCLPYAAIFQVWLVIILATITHVIQDEIKLRYVIEKKFSFPVFLFDQFLHILFLAVVLLFDFSYHPPEISNKIIQVYNNNNFVILLIGYLISVFMGAYLWEAFKASWGEKFALSGPRRIKYGMIERLLITTAFINIFLLPLLLIPLIARGLLKPLKFSYGFIFNLVYAALIGSLLKNVFPLF
jgi:hypothetical protein